MIGCFIVTDVRAQWYPSVDAASGHIAWLNCCEIEFVVTNAFGEPLG